MTAQPLRKITPIKPAPPTLAPADAAVVRDACARWAAMPGALLPILHAVQAAIGYVPRESLPLIAGALNLSLAEVHGVVTFYHYFRQSPGGRHIVHLCRAEACQALGGGALEAHAKRTLGIDFHGVTTDDAVRLEPVYCLGNCALGPSVMIDDQLQGRVSATRFDELVEQLRRSPRIAP